MLDLKSATTPIAKPAGATVAAKKGLPTVKDDAKGVPTITMPAGAAPTKLVVDPLIEGKGAAVKAGQTSRSTTSGAIWPGGKVFDSSYARGMASDTVIGEGEVIKGWDQGLVGQKVGSRVMLVIPPDDGYGTVRQHLRRHQGQRHPGLRRRHPRRHLSSSAGACVRQRTRRQSAET